MNMMSNAMFNNLYKGNLTKPMIKNGSYQSRKVQKSFVFRLKEKIYDISSFFNFKNGKVFGQEMSKMTQTQTRKNNYLLFFFGRRGFNLKWTQIMKLN